MKARQEGWLRRSRPSSRSSLASDGQVRSWEGAETRLLIPSPDRRHWLHHCQNNVRRAVREGVLEGDLGPHTRQRPPTKLKRNVPFRSTRFGLSWGESAPG